MVRSVLLLLSYLYFCHLKQNLLFYGLYLESVCRYQFIPSSETDKLQVVWDNFWGTVRGLRGGIKALANSLHVLLLLWEKHWQVARPLYLPQEVTPQAVNPLKTAEFLGQSLRFLLYLVAALPSSSTFSLTTVVTHTQIFFHHFLSVIPAPGRVHF